MTTLSAPEQLLLELINRARMDPAAEAARLGIDLNQFNTTGKTLGTESRQVLAGNDALAGIAESHSGVMHNSRVLSHDGAGDGTMDSRFQKINYPSGTWGYGENIAPDPGTTDLNTVVTNIHNQLFKDDPAWNLGSPIGHRLNILNDNFREVGNGVFTGNNGTYVTEDFGYHGTQWFLSGAAYNDSVIRDDFYSVGEGVAGVTATVTNAGGTVGSDTTGSGGGWTVGMPGGTYTVTFSGGGLAAPVAATVEAGSRNAKVDLVNGNEIFANVNTTLGTGASELHLLGMDNVYGIGNAGANVMVGNKGGNVLTGAGGNDSIDGAGGADTVVFSGLRSQYQVTVLSGTSATLADTRGGTPDGTDTISNVEFVRFADGTVNFSDLRTTVTEVAGSVAISDVTISEGNSGTKVATFTVTRSGGTAAFNVNYAASDGSATTADGDYVASANTLQFAANEMSKTISVTINGDTKVEANETFNLALSNATNGATISDAQGVGTITNDDAAPVAGSVAISDVTISEGNSGTKVATFTVTRNGGTAAFNVNYATSDGSATTADGDYVASANTLQFAANEMSKTISVTINGDTKVEANETFNLALSNATNGVTISDAQGVGTITNDDAAPVAGSVAISDVTISEGNSGTKVATFTVTRSGGTAAFNVNYATSNGSATTADGDYVASSNTLQFAANETSKTVSVTINGDTKVEANETFNVGLSGATNGVTISDAQGVGTITNDDANTNHAPVVTTSNASVAANGSVAASSLFAAHDQEGDSTITQYAFWDGGGGGGHFTVNGATQASGQWIYVNASDLGSVKYVGGSAAGSETLYVVAKDGQIWGDYASLTATTTALGNHAPVATSADHSLRTNEWSTVESWVGYSDADGNAATQYQFWDGGTATNSGYFWTPDNAHHAAGTAITVNAADLGNVWVRGGQTAGTETLWVRAFDGQQWSAWDSFNFTTIANKAPEVTTYHQTVGINELSQASWFIDYTDPDGDEITQFRFWDGGTGATSGYFSTPDNSHHAAGTAITVDAAHLEDVGFRGGREAGTETLWVQAFDGQAWSQWMSLNVTTDPYLYA